MNLSILSFNPPHDGSLAWIKDGFLKFSVEGEKDSNPRLSGIKSVPRALGLMSVIKETPDVISIGGGNFEEDQLYLGLSQELISSEKTPFFERSSNLFRSTHERAHIFCSYGLSPYPQGQPLYVLVWEGVIGRFYEIDEKLNVHGFDTVLSHPGIRYQSAYAIADYHNRKNKAWYWFIDHADAGKMMALASYGETMESVRRKDWT